MRASLVGRAGLTGCGVGAPGAAGGVGDYCAGRRSGPGSSGRASRVFKRPFPPRCRPGARAQSGEAREVDAALGESARERRGPPSRRGSARRPPARRVVRAAVFRCRQGGIVPVNTVPLAELEHAARTGIGISPVFDVFMFDDTTMASPSSTGPVTSTWSRRGWLSSRPFRLGVGRVDHRAQEGEPHPGCQRALPRGGRSARGCGDQRQRRGQVRGRQRGRLPARRRRSCSARRD